MSASRPFRCVILLTLVSVGLAGCGVAMAPAPPAQLLTQIEDQNRQQPLQQQLLAQASLATRRAPLDYEVGPEDLLEVIVFGQDSLNRTVRVNGLGQITLPLVG